MNQLNAMLSITTPLDGMLVDQRLPPAFCHTVLHNPTVPIDISGRREILLVKLNVSVLSRNTIE